MNGLTPVYDRIVIAGTASDRRCSRYHLPDRDGLLLHNTRTCSAEPVNHSGPLFLTFAIPGTTPHTKLNPVLIDTNLLIYLYDQNDSVRKDQALQLLDLLELTGSGRLSVQNLAEFFTVCTRNLSPSLTPSEALEQISLFARVWPIFDLTTFIVLEAGRGV